MTLVDPRHVANPFDDLLGDFLDESTRLLDRLNENLLALDEWLNLRHVDQLDTFNAEILNEMFRAAHSLKGLSAMLGLREINILTHKIESIFDAARRGELKITPDVVTVMFHAADRLTALVDALHNPDHASVDCHDVTEAIERLLAAPASARETAPHDDAPASALPMQTMSTQSSPTANPQEPPIDHFAAIVDETEVPSKYVSIFVDETDLALDNLTETLLALENGATRESIESLLIISHRIKGSAACVGYQRAARLAHFMEDVLQRLREERGTLSGELSDALLRCTDGLRKYVDGLKLGAPQSANFNQLALGLLAAESRASQEPQAQVDAGLARHHASRPQDAARVEPTAPADQVCFADLIARAPGSACGFVGHVRFTESFPLVGLKAQLLHEKLARVGQVFWCDPPAPTLADRDDLVELTFGVATDSSRESLLGQLHVAGVESIDIAAFTPRLASLQSIEASASSRPTRDLDINAMPRNQVEPPPPPAARSADTPASSAASPAKQGPAHATTPSRVTEARTAASPAEVDANAKPAAETTRPTETLRVDIERLDQLMNLAGQLVINKARFVRIGDCLKHVTSNKQAPKLLGDALSALAEVRSRAESVTASERPAAELELIQCHLRRITADLESVRDAVAQFQLVRGSVSDLLEAVHQLDRVSDGIQKSVMDTRMVPIGPLFGRFRRVVRDITRANGKDVRLVIGGEKTELDKRMIDELGDPLIHMVRNSADHGIESPEARELAGKPRQGAITLNAFHRGNSIVIQVQDDGKGLDQERIKAKAIEKGLISPQDAERLTPQQVFQLIWRPGFSTAETVTEISGRGMGMDIVKSKIEDLNGTVELDSTPGQGTLMQIKLPLTLAILPSLMARIDGEVFAFPMESVVEIVRVARNDITNIHGLPNARVRGRVISIVSLPDVFQWNTTRVPAPHASDGSQTLVVIGCDGREIGLVVDHLLGEEDIVIKSLAENFCNVPGIAGASILGDGRVSLILDIGALIEMSARKTACV